MAMINAPAVNELVARYKAKYNSEPPFSHTLMGYVAIQLYAAAVERAKKRRYKAGCGGALNRLMVSRRFSALTRFPTTYTFKRSFHSQSSRYRMENTQLSIAGRLKQRFGINELLRKGE